MKQCFDCGGIGHYKAECPVTKRKELKCLECKGIGHTKFECPNLQKGKEKSFLSFSKSDSDDDNEVVEDKILNFVAFAATTENMVSLDDSDAEEEGDVNSKEAYIVLYDSWVQLSKEKLQAATGSRKT